MKDIHYVVVSHTRFNDTGDPVHGTASELEPLLKKKNKNYIYIQHSLFVGTATNVIIYKNKKTISKKYGFTHLPFFLRIIQEFFITIYFVNKLESNSIRYIGIDPLNAWIGILLRMFNKVKKVVFYTADYAGKRYASAIMNYIYHSVDRFCVQHADQIWNVSSRITKLRKKQGVPEHKNYFIPNAPILSSKKRRLGVFEPHTMVIVTHITKAIDFESMFIAIKDLKRKYKDIKLLIVGNGDYRSELENDVRSMSIGKEVIFTGSQSHDAVMKILSKAGVGVAIYTDDFPWTKYGDSMKAREYLACGLPVIINDVPSTADDILKAKAGVIIHSSKKIKESIEYLFSNKRDYAIMRNNAFALAKQSDFSLVVEKTQFLDILL